MNSPIASPLDRAMELARQYAHAYHNHYTNGSTSIEGGLPGCENRLRAALAQLGTGSGAGAQSDSGADSGHATSAVPCLHPSVSEALRLAADALDYALPVAEDEWRTSRRWKTVGMEAIDRMKAARAALATVEGKEKTR